MDRRDFLKNLIGGSAAVATGTIIQETAQAQDPDWVKWVVNGCKKRFFRGFGVGSANMTVDDIVHQLDKRREAWRDSHLRFTACPGATEAAARMMREFKKPYPFSRMAEVKDIPANSGRTIRFKRYANLERASAPIVGEKTPIASDFIDADYDGSVDAMRYATMERGKSWPKEYRGEWIGDKTTDAAKIMLRATGASSERIDEMFSRKVSPELLMKLQGIDPLEQRSKPWFIEKSSVIVNND